jgi:hypothetical protein
VNPTFITIDDFYEDPYKVREYALTCEYDGDKVSGNYNNGNAPWPGKMSKKPYLVPGLDLNVGKMLKRNVIQHLGKDSGKFRISKLGDTSNNLVHADDSLNNYPLYAGVVYLNPDVIDTEGTIFYKHKPSNERVLTSKDEYKRIVANGEDKDISYWQRELVSYVTWNRLIIYPGHMFHGIGPLFGSTDESARLVQVFFWETVK